MGLPIGSGKRRRSYADYNARRPRINLLGDPRRIVVYVVLIGAIFWLIRNPELVMSAVKGVADSALAGFSEETGISTGPTPTPTVDPGSFRGAAEQAYQAGKLDEAIENYALLAENAPNDVDTHVQIARLLVFRAAMEYGDKQEETLQQAYEAADLAILANPEHPGGYAILGKVKDWQGHPGDGLNDIQRALELDPNYALAHGYMAEALIDLDRWDQAQAAAEQALALDPNSVDIHRDYAYVLESLGDYEGAAIQYEQALQLHSKLPNIRMALGSAYRVTGRYQEALDQFFAVEAIVPGNALIPFEVARTYETYIGDPASALEYYERAAELDPTFAAPFVRIGTLRYIEGSYPQAVTAFETAIRLGVTENVDVYYQLGLAYIYQGECENGLPHLQTARRLAEDDQRIIDIINSGFESCSQPPPEVTEEATEQADD